MIIGSKMIEKTNILTLELTFKDREIYTDNGRITHAKLPRIYGAQITLDGSQLTKDLIYKAYKKMAAEVKKCKKMGKHYA